MKIALMPATWPMVWWNSGSSWCGFDQHDEEEDAHRDECDDHGRELPLGGQHRDEPAHVHAGADVRGHLVEHLRGVAACLALHEREDGDLIDVASSACAGR